MLCRLNHVSVLKPRERPGPSWWGPAGRNRRWRPERLALGLVHLVPVEQRRLLVQEPLHRRLMIGGVVRGRPPLQIITSPCPQKEVLPIALYLSE